MSASTGTRRRTLPAAATGAVAPPRTTVPTAKPTKPTKTYTAPKTSTPHTTGASVVLLETYNDRNIGRKEPAVILFREAHTGLYTEPGGALDRPSEPPAECAQRELREETLGLFRIDVPSLLPGPFAGQGHPFFVREVTTHGGRHVAYAVHVAGPRGVGIRRDHYDHNRKLLAALGGAVPSHWRETDAMTRVYVRDLERAGLHSAPSNSTLTVTDVYGTPCTLHPRTVSLLRKVSHIGWTDTLALLQLQSAGGDGACSHGLGDAGTRLRGQTNGGQAKCYYFP